MRAVSIQMESALVFVSDAFSTVNRIRFTCKCSSQEAGWIRGMLRSVAAGELPPGCPHQGITGPSVFTASALGKVTDVDGIAASST